MFCHITHNWPATPLTSRLAVVELIAAMTTEAGLKIQCEIDTNTYEKGVKISDDEIANLNIKRDPFHTEWNYTIAPNTKNMEH